MNDWKRSILQIGLISLLLGCSRSTPSTNVGSVLSTQPGSTWVKIRSIAPDALTPLRRGTVVQFNVTVDYQLAEPSGALNLVIQNGSGELLGSSARVVSKGRGTAELEKSIAIPANVDTIEVFTPVLIQGETQTRVADLRFYKVR